MKNSKKAPSSSSSKKGKKNDPAPVEPQLFIPTPGQKLTKEQHAILRAQRAKALEDEKKLLFGSWTGSTPFFVLCDQCKKNQWDKPQVNTVSFFFEIHYLVIKFATTKD